MSFGSQRPRLQCVYNKPVEKIGIAGGVIGLTHPPEREQMAAVRSPRCLVDDRLACMARTSFGIDIGRRGKRDRCDPLRPRRRHLDRDGCSRMVANDSDLRQPQRVKQIEGAGGPSLDGIFLEGERVRVSEADGVHRNRAVVPTDPRQHVAILVPRTRRLVQQQDGPPLAGGRDVDARPGRVYEAAFNGGGAI